MNKDPIIKVPSLPVVVQQQPDTAIEPNLKPFQNNKKGGRANFFKRQEQKFGAGWSSKNKNLAREITSLVIDFAKGNITEEDILYFYDTDFSVVLRTVTADNLLRAEYQVQAGTAYFNNLQAEGKTPLPQYINMYQQDILRMEIWKDMHTFLFNLAEASYYGTQQVVATGMGFVNHMVGKYRSRIHLF